MTPGQRAYEIELQAWPRYEDGKPRKTWDQLSDLERLSWERNPTPRRINVDGTPRPYWKQTQG